MKNNLLKREGLPSFKPMLYPKAYEFYDVHESMHWTKHEYDLGEDVKDWQKLDENTQRLIKYVLRIFTQSDVMVGSGYDVLLRVFKPTEIQMMLRGFAARESGHIDSYSDFTDTLGFPEEFYEEYMEYEEMSNKISYVHNAKVKQFYEYLEMFSNEETEEEQLKKAEKQFKYDVAKMLAIYGGLTEGVSLFSSFAILMALSRTGVMNGLSTIVEWSIRDENIHCEGNSWLFRQFVNENKEIWNDELKREIYSSARAVIDLEDKFIDLAFDNGDIQGISREEMKQYIRYICDRRLIELSLKPNFGVKDNPLEWMEEILNSSSLSNFFETTVTDYGKGTTKGTWGDAKSVLEQFKG